MSLTDGINSNSPVVSIKRGDTIRWAGQYGTINLTGYTLECEIRSEAGALLGTPTVTLGNQGVSPGSFSIYMASTAAIAAGRHIMDLRITEPDTDTYATESWVLNVTEQVTAP